MDYLKHYQALVEKAQKRSLSIDTYYETHHIVPRCLGGSNEVKNLVRLTAKEHFFAHLLLTRIYPEENKLHVAFWFMCNQRGRGKQVNRTTPSSRQYANAKKAFIEVQKKEKAGIKNPEQSVRMKKNNPNYKPGVKEKQSTAKKGKPVPEEVKKKISKTLTGRVVDWGWKVSKTRIERGLGKDPKSAEHKKKISEALKGLTKPQYTCPHCNKVGKGASNMYRWHFEKCKNKNNSDQKNTDNSQADPKA